MMEYLFLAAPTANFVILEFGQLDVKPAERAPVDSVNR